MINVLLIEDSAVFVMGLRLALGANPSFGSIESVASPGAAVAYLNAHPETDIAVVDITLESETDGLTLLGILRDAFPGVKALVLSHYKIPSYILRAITSGACAYLAKDSSPESIVDAIMDVAAGKCLFFGETIDSGKILRSFGGKENLNARKPQGLVNTVDSYKERIKGKFGLDSIVECVATAAAKGIVTV